MKVKYHCYGKKGGKPPDLMKTLWIEIKIMKYAWRNSITMVATKL